LIFLPILTISSTFLSSFENSSDYKNLLTYEPELLVFQDFSLVGFTRVDFKKLSIKDSYILEWLNPVYYRKYYSNKYEYDLSVSGKEIIYYYKDTKLYINLWLQGIGQYYPINELLFTSLSFNLIPELYKGDSWDRRFTGEIKMGFGFGRMIPISPMDKAINIQKELLGLGVITDSFSDEILKEIANIISQKANYNDPRDFWMELERIIVSSGLTEGEKLGAAPTIRLNEIFITYIPWNWSVPERTRDIYDLSGSYFRSVYMSLLEGREKGFEVEIYIGDRYKSNYSKRNNLFLGGRFDYSYPLSQKLQISFNSISEFFTGDTLKWRKANVKTELTYEIYRRLFSRFGLRYNGLNSNYLWVISHGFDYLIEYKMVLSTDFSIIYSADKNDFYGRFSLGLNYLFF
jgi:hypothetical protein